MCVHDKCRCMPMPHVHVCIHTHYVLIQHEIQLLAQHSELHQSACQTEQVTQLLQQANTEIVRPVVIVFLWIKVVYLMHSPWPMLHFPTSINYTCIATVLYFILCTYTCICSSEQHSSVFSPYAVVPTTACAYSARRKYPS